MAIAIDLRETDSNLFCASKWWGDPDMPSEMEYPTHEDYPLTFLCQINCEYLEKYDPQGLLPHTGMLYFFAAADSLLGYESPLSYGEGEWPRGAVRIKYSKDINFETFQSFEMVGEDGESVTDTAMEILFAPCDDGYPGLRLLGDAPEGYGDFVCLLQAAFGPEKGQKLCFLMKPSDISFGNWKKCTAVLV